MRRPLRNIEIFSMSVLDMFASALGAFIMIAVILFPYFNQARELAQTEQKVEQITEQLRVVTSQVRRDEENSRLQQLEIGRGNQFRTALESCRSNLDACKAQATKLFLVVGIEWDERCDVDLYVTDPEGRTFSYQAKTGGRSGADAQNMGNLIVDRMDGPGIEVWQTAVARPGIYQIGYKPYIESGNCPALSSPADSVFVKGWIIDRSEGQRSLPEKTLKRADASNVANVASVRVSADGVATIQR